MDAKKCDICGNFFEYFKYDYWVRVGQKPFQKPRKRKYEVNKNDGCYMTRQLDICPDCYKALIEFAESRKGTK